MLNLLGKKKARQHLTECPDCGCALTDPHWRNCPRCRRELKTGGCGGCGACGK